MSYLTNTARHHARYIPPFFTAVPDLSGIQSLRAKDEAEVSGFLQGPPRPHGRNDELHRR